MTLRRAAALTAAALLAGAAACTPEPAPSTLDGAHVDVVGLWSGPELTAFETVAAGWQDATGGVVDWTGPRALATDLDARIAAGDPPDVAVLPNPGLLRDLAEEDALVPLDTVLDVGQVHRDYPAAWTDLGSVDGELYGLVAKASDKSTVWYSPAAFSAAGYAVPATWDDLLALADEVVADGTAPLSVVAPRGPSSGWALTDWVSAIVLRACGPATYDAWVAAAIPWTEACVAASFDRFAALLAAPGYVLGGVRTVLATGDAEGVLPLFTDPPDAYAYAMASFAQAFITAAHPDLVPGEGYDWFPFPAIDPSHAGAITVGGDLVVLLTDTPAARSFLAYLGGAEAQTTWVGLGGSTSVNRSVPDDAYADPVALSVAQHLQDAFVVRFGAGDLVPADVQQAWCAAMLRLVTEPGAVDGVLAAMTEVTAG